MAQPSAQEQYMLELINRARANPNAEAARLGVALNQGLSGSSTISSSAKQPLAFNPLLIDAARGHSQFLLNSNTFSHAGAGNSTDRQRVERAGYSFVNGGSIAENLAWRGTTGVVNETQFIEVEHEDLYRSASHRVNIFAEQPKEIGIGALVGPFTQTSSETGQPTQFNSLLTTQKYTNSGNGGIFLTGVAFNDAVTNDDFYTVGEGLGGIQVDALSPIGQRFSTTTYGSGGYSLPIATGSHTVFFSGGALGSQVVQQQVSLGNQNVKLDLEFGPNSPALTTLDPLQYAASHGDLLQAFGVNTTALFDHYLSAGFREGRAFDSFDEAQYLASYGDLLQAFGANFQAATQHYVQSGFQEGRAADVFDEARYLASNGDLIAAFGYDLATATSHYISHGALEGRAVTAFDPAAYLNNYSDLQSTFGTNFAAATRHFIEFGFAEGRSA